MTTRIERRGAGWHGKRSEIYKAGCAKRRAKTWPGFISPEGVPYGPIINLAAFCREHDLDSTAMRLVSCGEYQSHHGWTRLEEVTEGVVPVPYSGVKYDVYLVLRDYEDFTGPIKTQKDIRKASLLLGAPEWKVRELLSKEREELNGWRREEDDGRKGGSDDV